MGRIRTSRPSPVIIASVLALVAALAGTAVAGPDASTSAVTKKKVKKIAKKQAIKQINALAPGLSVASADTADSANRADTANSANTANTASRATQAESATNAVNATNAASAQPAAFAHVNEPGTLDVANSKNAGSVSRVSEGIYCFSGIAFTPRGGQATVDTTGGVDEYAEFGIGDCPGFLQPGVETFDAAGAHSDAPFFVVFYR
jgi:hypothetical protein